jgi:FAD/FMN-containing dehydrogenase
MTLNSMTSSFEAHLRSVIGEAAFKADSDSFLSEPRGRWQGQGVVVSPVNVEEVSALMAACFEARVPVVPYSGGTGLVGGQIAPDGAVPVAGRTGSNGAVA